MEYKCLQGLMEKISIAVNAVDIEDTEEISIEANIEKKFKEISEDANSIKQLKQLLFALEKLYALPLGRILLDHLCKLLTDHDDKLFFSLKLEDGTTPKTDAKRQQIPCGGKTSYIEKWHSAFIILPKNIPENMELVLYDPQKKEVIKIAEPFEIIIGHELIHCVQNLIYGAQKTGSTIRNQIMETNRNNSISTDEKSVKWYEAFWGGSNLNTWPDELQAMLLGIEIDGKKISEATLLQDFLESKTLPNVFQGYQNKELIPFGHMDPKDENTPLVESDKERFEKLLFQLGKIKNYKGNTILENSSEKIQPRIIGKNEGSQGEQSKKSSCIIA